jgi:hypothetical protein
MMAPFSMLRGSVGRPSCAHLALVLSSVSMSSGLMPSQGQGKGRGEGGKFELKKLHGHRGRMCGWTRLGKCLGLH